MQRCSSSRACCGAGFRRRSLEEARVVHDRNRCLPSGFDFIHSALLLPELLEHLHKKVVINSFSFVHPNTMISKEAKIVWPLSGAEIGSSVKQVDAKTDGSSMYRPEVRRSIDRSIDRPLPH